jgi:hypothetical protein
MQPIPTLFEPTTRVMARTRRCAYGVLARRFRCTACIAAIDRSRMPLTTKWLRTSRIVRCRNNLGYLSAPVLPRSRPSRVLGACRTTLNAGRLSMRDDSQCGTKAPTTDQTTLAMQLRIAMQRPMIAKIRGAPRSGVRPRVRPPSQAATAPRMPGAPDQKKVMVSTDKAP